VIGSGPFPGLDGSDAPLSPLDALGVEAGWDASAPSAAADGSIQGSGSDQAADSGRKHGPPQLGAGGGDGAC
jgi:hypothetical protein